MIDTYKLVLHLDVVRDKILDSYTKACGDALFYNHLPSSERYYSGLAFAYREVYLMLSDDVFKGRDDDDE